MALISEEVSKLIEHMIAEACEFDTISNIKMEVESTDGREERVRIIVMRNDFYEENLSEAFRTSKEFDA